MLIVKVIIYSGYGNFGLILLGKIFLKTNSSK